MRYLLYLLFLLGISLYIIVASNPKPFLVQPNFLIDDPIRGNDSPYISIHNHSLNSLSLDQIDLFKNDYISIWKHLDHFHNTNDMVVGKQFYSEPFFKQLVKDNPTVFSTKLRRMSLHHKVYIKNISPDGLICTILDSNILIKYQTSQYYYFDTINVAMVLLFQGDNWRVDAIQQF